MTGYKVSAQKH